MLMQSACAIQDAHKLERSLRFAQIVPLRIRHLPFDAIDIHVDDLGV